MSAVAYFYLALVSKLQPWIYQSLPKALGFQGTPAWWPVPILLVAGVLVAATITYLPGTSGHEPANGFKLGTSGATGAIVPSEVGWQPRFGADRLPGHYKIGGYYDTSEAPYLGLRDQVLRYGVDSWKLPVSTVAAASIMEHPLSYREQLNRLLNQENPHGS